MKPVLKVMSKTPERARRPTKRNCLVVGTLLVIGTSALAACASNAASTAGLSTVNGAKGASVAGDGMLDTSPPTVLQQAVARAGHSTAKSSTTATPKDTATKTTPAGSATQADVPSAGSATSGPQVGTSASGTGTGSQTSGSGSSIDPSGASPASTLSGFTLNYLQEFTGSSLPSGWEAYSGADNGPQATDSKAHFDPSLCEFTGGEALFMASGTNTCGLHHTGAQEYGAWFGRLRTDSMPSGETFTDIFLLWPAVVGWPPEIDIYEDGGDRSKTTANVYNTAGSVCGSSPTATCLAPYAQNNISSHGVANDNTQWHTYGVEWTPSGISWLIDGNVVFTASASAVKSPAQQPATPMDMDLQVQSLGSGTSVKTETMAVDWVEQFTWDG